MLHCLRRHGLLPPEPSPPLAMPYHRIRRQWQPSWVGAQIGLLPVRCMEMCGLKRVGSQWLDGMLRSNPDNLEWLTHRAGQALSCFDFATARELIERIWVLDGEAALLHQLLFRRGSRPGDRRDQLALFDALAASSVLPQHFAGYCRVVRTYRAIDQKDSEMLRRCCAALTPMIEALSSDPDTYCCLRPNRENRAKLLISAHLTRLRALMEREDHGALDAAAQDLEACSARYDLRHRSHHGDAHDAKHHALPGDCSGDGLHSGHSQRFNAVVDGWSVCGWRATPNASIRLRNAPRKTIALFRTGYWSASNPAAGRTIPRTGDPKRLHSLNPSFWFISPRSGLSALKRPGAF